MLSFVSDPGFPAFLLFLILMCKITFKKNLVNGIVGYMLAVFMLDYFFEASCTTFLLFVDF